MADRWLARQLASRTAWWVLVAGAAVLSAGALTAVAASVGFDLIWKKLIYPHWYWIPIALAGELVAYLGYTLGYREVARAERGELDVPSVAALVATGSAHSSRAASRSTARPSSEPEMTERQAKERVLRLGMLEYAVLAPATLVAAAFLLAEKGERIDPSMTLPWVIGVLVGAALMPHPSGSLQANSWRYPAWYLG